jgi:hypothetical protein
LRFAPPVPMMVARTMGVMKMRHILRRLPVRSRAFSFAVCLLLGINILVVAEGVGQHPGAATVDGQTGPTLSQDGLGHPLNTPEPEDTARRQMEKTLELRRNEERQKQLVKDTNRLLALTTELKTEVDKTNKDMLSVEVVKKADEIEKLAKSVKDRMRSQ